MPEVSAFLRITDYVLGQQLCCLSAEDLHTIVCGPDGKLLQTIRSKSGAELVQFVSAPYPGFRIIASEQKLLNHATRCVVNVMWAIKAAAMDAAGGQSLDSCSTTSPLAFFDPAPKQRVDYHPLFSSKHGTDPRPFQDGLLPLPPSRKIGKAKLSAAVPMQDFEKSQILIQSPYLQSFCKRRCIAMMEADVIAPASSPPNEQGVDKLLVKPSFDLHRSQRVNSKLEEQQENMAHSLDDCMEGSPSDRITKFDRPIVPTSDSVSTEIEVEIDESGNIPEVTATPLECTCTGFLLTTSDKIKDTSPAQQKKKRKRTNGRTKQPLGTVVAKVVELAPVRSDTESSFSRKHAKPPKRWRFITSVGWILSQLMRMMATVFWFIFETGVAYTDCMSQFFMGSGRYHLGSTKPLVSSSSVQRGKPRRRLRI